MRARRVARGAAVLIVGALALGGAACSSDDGEDSASTTTTPAEATCDAWSATTEAFGSLGQIDIVNDGLNSVRTYVDDLQVAVQELDTAVSAQYKPLVGDLKASLENLQTGATSGTVVVEGLGAQLDEVETAWNALVSELQTACPDVTADTASL